MVFGDFNPSCFFKLPFYFTIATLFIIYQISQYYGHEKPFPHCWISAVADHYPQFLFFRISTITGSAMIALGWFTNHFYLRTISKEKAFRVSKYHPQIALILGLIGSMLLMGSTANIDTGRTVDDWHTFCASNFFVFTLIAQLYNTAVGWIIHSNIKTISLGVLYLKLVILIALFGQLLISSIYGELRIDWETGEKFGNDLDKLLEWTLTATVLAGFYAMSLDLTNFKMSYETVSKVSGRRMNIIQEMELPIPIVE